MNIYYLHVRGSVDDIMWGMLQTKLENVGTVRPAPGCARTEPQVPPAPLCPATSDRPAEAASAPEYFNDDSPIALVCFGRVLTIMPKKHLLEVVFGCFLVG